MVKRFHEPPSWSEATEGREMDTDVILTRFDAVPSRSSARKPIRYPRMDTEHSSDESHHTEATDMDVQGIFGSMAFREPTPEVKQAREQRLVAHDALPKIKSPEEAQKLIDDVKHLLLYG